MSRRKKRELLWAVERGKELLARNANAIETFHGVLNRADVRALHSLVRFAERSLHLKQHGP